MTSDFSFFVISNSIVQEYFLCEQFQQLIYCSNSAKRGVLSRSSHRVKGVTFIRDNFHCQLFDFLLHQKPPHGRYNRFRCINCVPRNTPSFDLKWFVCCFENIIHRNRKVHRMSLL